MRLSRVATCIGVAFLVVAANAAWAEGYLLRLRTRSFVPDPGIASATSYLSASPGEPGHVLVQLYDPNDPSIRAELERNGFRFVQYLPDAAWIVTVDRASLTADAARPYVRFAGALSAADRLHPQLLAEGPRAWARTPEGRWRLHVRFHADVARSDARASLAAIGALVTAELPFAPAFEIVTDRAGCERLAGNDRVSWIRETSPPHAEANDQIRSQSRTGLLQAPPYGLDGSGVTAAVWDAGSIDASHPDFGGRVTVPDGAPLHQHATHVGGTLGGSGAQSTLFGGTAGQWRGVAPALSILSYDWDDALAEHAPAIHAHGASISQNSWTYVVASGAGNCDLYGDYDFDAPEYDEIATGAAGGPIVVAFAAGNERDDGDCGMVGEVNFANVPPPGTAKNVLTVGAINTNDDTMTDFSSWGPVDDGRLKPEIVAGGCQLDGEFGVTSTFIGGGYGVYCGTSMATPTVSGSIALLQELHRSRDGFLPSASLVKALLVSTARDLGKVGPDYRFGFGALDAKAAADLVRSGAYVEGVALSTSDEREVAFHVGPGQLRVQVTLSWIDPPASPLAASTLVNDLELVLVAPNGAEHHAWVLDPDLPDAPATRGANHRDPIEQVTVYSPLQGAWSARVRATSLPEGPQLWSLVGTTPSPPCAGNRLDAPGSFGTIQGAIDAASACDTVVVAPGTYQEHLRLDEPIVLLASGGPALTTLLGPVSDRVLDVSADATIDGFTVRGGTAVGGGTSGLGGGLLSTSSSPLVRNCTFRACFAAAGGAGAYASGGAPRFVACIFDSNRTDGAGGGLALSATEGAEITGSVFHDGTAAGDGGAIAIDLGSATIRKNTIVRNAAGGAGGGLRAQGATFLTLANNIFAANVAVSAAGALCSGFVVSSCNDYWIQDRVDCGGGVSDFSADPAFCDAAHDDFTFELSSPCAPGQTPGSCGLVGARDPVAGCATVGVPGGATALLLDASLVDPNPFRTGTRIHFRLSESSPVVLDLYDVSGRLVRALWKGALLAGNHELGWDGRDDRAERVKPGVYFYELRAGSERATRKLVVLR